MNGESGLKPIGAILALLLLGVASCGGGGGGSETPRAETVTIQADLDFLMVATRESVPLAPIVHVTGTADTGVNWTVSEGAVGGTVSAAGIYTAPDVPGTYQVVATSRASALDSVTIVIEVGELSIAIMPSEDTLGRGSVRRFDASVFASDDRVTWSVLEGEAGGSMSGDRYTAPTALGTYHVVAASVFDPDVSAIATIEVVGAGFHPAATALHPRILNTATPLQDGRILIAGGDICNGWFHELDSCATATAEILDPATGTSSATGAMQGARLSHLATLLADGRVLIVGGSQPGAELYDPATGVFSATGSMPASLQVQTATLLADRTVLLTVAQDEGPGTGQIYDPATGTIAATTGAMLIRRGSHTATRLADGRVLIAGGHQFDSTAEIYDPATGMFVSTGAMNVKRIGPVATPLDDGKVLITGGWWFSPPRSLTVSSAAEIYDPATGQFSATGSMRRPRRGHSAAVLPDGRVLVSGGNAPGSPAYAFTAELFDPATELFTATGSMATGRLGAAAIPLGDGSVLVVGGAPGLVAEVYE